MPARWVTADAGYGRSHAFRRWLEEHGRSYAVAVPSANAVHVVGRRQTVEKIGAQLTDADWTMVEATAGAPGHAWACIPLFDDCPLGMRRWLVIRRLADDPDELTYVLAYGPDATTREEFVHVCRIRWVIEECGAHGKGKVGLDQPGALWAAVRTWDAWHRVITRCLLAHAVLVVVRGQATGDETDVHKGG